MSTVNPADRHVCPDCEMAHLPGAPHYMSMAYQRRIYETFGRIATEADLAVKWRADRLVTNREGAA